jgi:uncharacterized membrane protein (DUF2068 family)
MKVTGVLRGIAVFEATKGLLVLLVGMGALSILHLSHNVQSLAEQWVTHFHLNPASRYPRIFLDLTAQLTNQHLWWLAAFAVIYAAARFVEAFGLWHERTWAEWFAALSSGIYLPIEIVELTKGINSWRVGTFLINLLITGFMVYSLHQQKRAARNPPSV